MESSWCSLYISGKVAFSSNVLLGNEANDMRVYTMAYQLAASTFSH